MIDSGRPGAAARPASLAQARRVKPWEMSRTCTTASLTRRARSCNCPACRILPGRDPPPAPLRRTRRRECAERDGRAFPGQSAAAPVRRHRGMRAPEYFNSVTPLTIKRWRFAGSLQWPETRPPPAFVLPFLVLQVKFQSGFLGIFTLDKELLEPRFPKEDLYFSPQDIFAGQPKISSAAPSPGGHLVRGIHGEQTIPARSKQGSKRSRGPVPSAVCAAINPRKSSAWHYGSFCSPCAGISMSWKPRLLVVSLAKP